MRSRLTYNLNQMLKVSRQSQRGEADKDDSLTEDEKYGNIFCMRRKDGVHHFEAHSEHLHQIRL